MIRQGDVLVSEARIPQGAVEVKKTPLALGELSGHAHEITSGEYTEYAFEGARYLDVTSEYAVVSHTAKTGRGDHRPQVLLRGAYQVTIQAEQTADGWEPVVD